MSLHNVDESLYCYKPTKILKKKKNYVGFYQFSARGSSYRMIKSLPLFDRLWKREFFFVSRSWDGDPIEVGRDVFPPYVGAMGCLRSKGLLLTLARLEFLISSPNILPFFFSCNLSISKQFLLELCLKSSFFCRKRLSLTRNPLSSIYLGSWTYSFGRSSSTRSPHSSK